MFLKLVQQLSCYHYIILPSNYPFHDQNLLNLRISISECWSWKSTRKLPILSSSPVGESYGGIRNLQFDTYLPSYRPRSFNRRLNDIAKFSGFIVNDQQLLATQNDFSLTLSLSHFVADEWLNIPLANRYALDKPSLWFSDKPKEDNGQNVILPNLLPPQFQNLKSIKTCFCLDLTIFFWSKAQAFRGFMLTSYPYNFHRSPSWSCFFLFPPS